MWELTEKYSGERQIDTNLFLPFEMRQRSRLKVTLENGEEASIILPRGGILRDGELLLSRCNKVIAVKAADESVSTVIENNPLSLARAAYHLGNRHVALQIEDGFLRYLHDHILDQMVRELGLSVLVQNKPFEPEPGAYAGHSHTHSHDE
ncbi:MAG TPA: urease accessory protein UreE [Porticoccaceae bacterium]|jgi:urease accessory protein|nr:urease accessory protein UreE [Gammaproteobacteria bacterium]HIL60340.1 urease accessory protein UreE [Porticoccaceae bacterium]